MTKKKFIAEMRSELQVLSNQDLEERLNFYGEMIDDKIENGTPEEDAVKELGPVKIIASQILSDYNLTKKQEKIVKEKRRLKGWEKALLIIGSPLWIAILVAIVSVIFSIVVSTFAVIFSLYVSVFVTGCVVSWSCFVAFGVGAIGGVILSVVFTLSGSVNSGIAVFGSSVACIGLAILFFFFSKWITRVVNIMTKKTFEITKKVLSKRRKCNV